MLIKVIDKENNCDFFIHAKNVEIDFQHNYACIRDNNDNNYVVSMKECELKSLSKWLWLNRSWSIHGRVVVWNA